MTLRTQEAANLIIVVLAGAVLTLDQLTKFGLLNFLDLGQEREIIEGFFKFVHWGNTGAAWSLFSNNNRILALVSLAALAVLLLVRHHFDNGSVPGKVALGLLLGGILGNLADRVFRGQVIDFLRFYIHQRGGDEIGFPAVNVADSAICIGVGLLFILSCQKDDVPRSVPPAAQEN